MIKHQPIHTQISEPFTVHFFTSLDFRHCNFTCWLHLRPSTSNIYLFYTYFFIMYPQHIPQAIQVRHLYFLILSVCFSVTSCHVGYLCWLFKLVCNLTFRIVNFKFNMSTSIALNLPNCIYARYLIFYVILFSILIAQLTSQIYHQAPTIHPAKFGPS